MIYYPVTFFSLIQGTLKGLLGIICDATPTHVVLELHSQFKKVPVARENMALLDSGGRIMDTQYGATTPRITPMREMRTPQVRIGHFLIMLKICFSYLLV